MSCRLTTEVVCGPIFLRPSGELPKGAVVPGHRHNHAHATILVRGAVRVRESRPDGTAAEHEHREPLDAWATEADVLHEITALEDGTVFGCVFAHRDGGGSVVQTYAGNDRAYAAVPPFPGTE